MPAEASALAFEAIDFESCSAILREFFRQHPSASMVKVRSFDTRSQAIGGAHLAGQRWQF